MIKEKILAGKTSLGIELGSTRIKAALIDDNFEVIATGSHDWENSFCDGFWTYSLDSMHNGVRGCFSSLLKDLLDKFRGLISNKGYEWDIEKILPQVRKAGEKGAVLTQEGAKFLAITGNLKAGIPVCPPEGDAGTGMALLAEYMRTGVDKSLGDWMEDVVFASAKTQTLEPSKEGTEEFKKYIERYKLGLSAQKNLATVE